MVKMQMGKAISLALFTSLTLGCTLRASDRLSSGVSAQLSSESQVARIKCKILDRTPKREFAVENAGVPKKIANVTKEELADKVIREVIVVGPIVQEIDLSDARFFVHIGVYTGNFQIQLNDRKTRTYLAMAEAAEQGFSSLNLSLKDPIVDVRCELLPRDPTNPN